MAATAVMQFSYWPILMGATGLFLPDRHTGYVWLGLALVPFVFLVLAFGSRHPRASGAVLRAMGLFLVIGMPVSVLVGPVVGIPLGFAAGGVTALRPPEDHAGVRRARIIAVVAGILYVIVMFFVAPLFAAFVAAVMPLAVIGMSDQALDWRARERARSSQRRPSA